MAEYDETTYGERIAEVYDLFYGKRDNPETIADFLAPLAGKRRALELGIGTGRIAIPLAARGVRVVGIDASPAMVAKMRAKPGGADIPVVMGNFASGSRCFISAHESKSSGARSAITSFSYSLPRVMTVKEMSGYLRVHPSTVYKLLRRGDLPGFRIGRDWRFNGEVIDRWCLERNMKASDGGTSNQN